MLDELGESYLYHISARIGRFFGPRLLPSYNHRERIQQGAVGTDAENEWERIAEFNIVNHEGKDMNYTITSFINGKSCNSSVRIPSNRTYTYIRHIYMEELVEDEVTFKVYKEGWSLPIDELTYYLNLTFANSEKSYR